MCNALTGGEVREEYMPAGQHPQCCGNAGGCGRPGAAGQDL